MQIFFFYLNHPLISFVFVLDVAEQINVSSLCWYIWIVAEPFLSAFRYPAYASFF